MPLEQQQIDVNDHEMLNGLFNKTILLFCAIIAFVAAEIFPILGMTDFIVNHNVPTRMLLIMIQLLFMLSMLNTILRPPISGFYIMVVVVIMVIICVMGVLLVLMISTIAAILTGIMWSITILIVVVKKWIDIVMQIKEIRIAMANIFSRA